MNETRFDGIRNELAALLVFIVSIAAIVSWGFCAFAISNPDGTTTLLDVVFFPPLVGIYLLFTLVGAALGAWLWRASPGWIAFIAASPYLLWAIIDHGMILWGVTLLTFGVQYGAVRLRKSGPKSNVA